MLGGAGTVNDAVTAADAALQRCRSMAAAGQERAALANAKQAVRLYKQLSEQQPEVFHPDLALALQTQSDVAAAAGRPDDALAAARAAVDLFRALCQGPTSHSRDAAAEALAEAVAGSSAADALADAAAGSSAADALADAAAGSSAADALADESELGDPILFRPYLGSALCTLASRLHESGDDSAALETVREGIHLFDNADADDLRRHRAALDAARLLRNELSPDEHLLDEEFDHRPVGN